MSVGRKQIVISKRDSERVVAVPSHDPFVEEFREFYDTVVSGKDLSVQPEELLDDLRFVEAALLSAEEGRPVSLAEVGSGKRMQTV